VAKPRKQLHKASAVLQVLQQTDRVGKGMCNQAVSSSKGISNSTNKLSKQGAGSQRKMSKEWEVLAALQQGRLSGKKSTGGGD
jgi:CHASE3 domain sensor protein